MRSLLTTILVLWVALSLVTPDAEARRVSAYEALLPPSYARVVPPWGVWRPPVCEDGRRAYTDVSAYRRNGKALGPQELMGRHSYWWSSRWRSSRWTYGVLYNKKRARFWNQTWGPILAAVWCDKWGLR